jgi:LIM domain/Protein DA1
LFVFNRLVCQQCGKPILGQYITALNAAWHPEHFLCAACHRPIADNRFNVKDDQPYHPQCYVERVAPRCASCGQPLTGRYVQAEGKSYHPDCYRDHVVPRCAYCNEPLVGEYLVDAWGTKCCKRHKQEYPTCEFCGRLIPPSQQERAHAGYPRAIQSVRCPVCRSRAVESLSQARPLFAAVAQWAGTQLPAFNGAVLSLELCDRATLARHMLGRGGAQGGEPHTLGVTLSTTHTLNGREVRTEVNGIALLQGLPTPLFQGTLAHELGHAWLVMQGIKGLPQWSEEGLCELLAHRYYTHVNSPESRYYAESIERNPNPIYGDGFRRVRDTCARLGFTNYVTALRETKRPPA